MVSLDIRLPSPVCALALERPAPIWAHPVRMWLKRGLLCRKLHCPASPSNRPSTGGGDMGHEEVLIAVDPHKGHNTLVVLDPVSRLPVEEAEFANTHASPPPDKPAPTSPPAPACGQEPKQGRLCRTSPRPELHVNGASGRPTTAPAGETGTQAARKPPDGLAGKPTPNRAAPSSSSLQLPASTRKSHNSRPPSNATRSTECPPPPTSAKLPFASSNDRVPWTLHTPKHQQIEPRFQSCRPAPPPEAA